MRFTLALFFFLGKHEIRWYCHASMSAFRSISLLLVSLLVGVQVACQSVTPTDRIGSNPVMFRMLPPEQQSLVQQGRICKGMSPDAVLLAWGKPNAAPIEGEKDGKKLVRWVYKSYEPVMVTTDWFGAPVCGPRGWCDPFYAGTGTAYVPTDSAYVEFTNGKVSAWERKR